jgi:ornithine carbamoyltransferase
MQSTDPASSSTAIDTRDCCEAYFEQVVGGAWLQLAGGLDVIVQTPKPFHTVKCVYWAQAMSESAQGRFPIANDSGESATDAGITAA